MASYDDLNPTKTTTAASLSLKCEKELIPVLAGECRANPITTPIEKSLIRSASAEVIKTTTDLFMLVCLFVLFLAIRM